MDNAEFISLQMRICLQTFLAYSQRGRRGVRQKQLRQVVTATADGAIAAVMAEKYVEDQFH